MKEYIFRILVMTTVFIKRTQKKKKKKGGYVFLVNVLAVLKILSSNTNERSQVHISGTELHARQRGIFLSTFKMDHTHLDNYRIFAIKASLISFRSITLNSVTLYTQELYTTEFC